MSTARHRALVAVHLFLIKKDQVLLARRCNTGYEDGNWSVPAGHVDEGESVTAALCREAKEEIGLILQPKNLKCAHVMHRLSDADRVDFFFTCAVWSGQPGITEPNKCDGLEWFSLTNLPPNIIPYIKIALSHVQAMQSYSELGW